MAVPTTQITGHTTAIPGLLWFDVTCLHDNRGYYQEKYQKAKLAAAGLPEDFTIVQSSITSNKTRGGTRGFHAEPWDKYVSPINGRVFVAYVDLRKGDSFGKTVSLELDETKAVFLPKGVGNSYQTLTDDLYYMYSVNAYWSEEVYKTATFVNLGDPVIGIEWPIPLNEATLSDRDRDHPNLADIKPMEV